MFLRHNPEPCVVTWHCVTSIAYPCHSKNYGGTVDYSLLKGQTLSPFQLALIIWAGNV